MYILETEQSFEAAHFLSGYRGKCKNIHGHRWRVVARICAQDQALGTEDRDPQTRDMVMDFGDFKEALGGLTGELDHSLIIEEGSLKPKTMEALREEDFRIVEFPFRPTAERFSEYFFRALKDQSVPVTRVTVYETPTNCASYQEDVIVPTASRETGTKGQPTTFSSTFVSDRKESPV